MYLFHDTETTGKTATSNICQMAMMLVDRERNVVGVFKTLIKPAGWAIHPEAHAVHGVTLEECEAYGLGIKSALGLFNAWAAKADIYIGHNPDFDIARMKYEGEANGFPVVFPPETFCTMKGSTQHCKLPGHNAGQYKWPTLQEAHEVMTGKRLEGAHDSFNDVRATARIYFHLIDKEREEREERQKQAAQNG